MKRFCLALVMMAALTSVVLAQRQPVLQDDAAQAAWHEDLSYMAERMQEIHPNLFWRTPEAEFHQAIADLEAQLPYLTDEQVKVGIIKIVALIDGHTQVGVFQPALNFHLYPLRLYDFSDGLYVVDAQPAYQEAVGKRLVSIGHLDVESAYRQMALLAQHDNDYMLKLVTAFFMVLPEALHGSGVIADVNQPQFVVEDANGERVTVNPTPLTLDDYLKWGNGHFITLPPQSETLYLSQQYEEYFWFTFLEDSKTLYVQYNEVRNPTQSGETMSAFAKRIAAFLDTTPVARVVIDVRHNSGGDNHYYPPLLNLFVGNEALDQPGKLFVITSRMTLSAATNFAAEMEQKTQAIFVGEPTGEPPNVYGDPRAVTLPNSKIVVNVSSRYWQKSTADDTRLWIEPDIPVTFSSADFFNGRDPSLEAILSYQP
jgi:hypothetical protein